jgi:predicted transcriptional regulator YdeE
MVAARLLQIELEGRLAGADVLLKRIEALPIAALRETVPALERLPHYLQRMTERLGQGLAAANLKVAGPWLALYHVPEYRERNIPLELGVVVAPEALQNALAASSAGFGLRKLPAVEQMACLVHTGPIEGLQQAYAGLYAWMEAHRYHPAGPARELYLRDESAGRTSQVIEVQIPVERAGANLSNHTNLKEIDMQPKIVTKPAFNVVGMCYHGNNQNQEIAVMWQEFMPRMGEIERINPTLSYGVCSMPEGLPDGHFEYVAGVEVKEGAPVPDGMVLRRVPEMKYAVFAHRGPLETLHKTYQNIHQVGLPEAGLEVLQSGLDMEVYTEEFTGFSPDSVLYIYVPVK